MRKTIDTFFKFMWNVWDEEICNKIFGSKGKQIWYRWIVILGECQFEAAPALFWAEVDAKTTQAICDYIESTGYKG